MKTLTLIFLYFISFTSVLSSQNEEDKYYIQLYPSEDKDKPEELNFFNLKSEYYTINSTDKEDMKITNRVISNETPIKHLSSVILFNKRFLIKTCFGPYKIVEIKDENNGEIFTPKDDYFKHVKKNLENIKYCFSTAIKNPLKENEYLLFTYWTESSSSNGIEIYSHKYILFNPSSKVFTNIGLLDNEGNNFYAQSCTNLLYEYVYCNIDQSFSISKTKHFSLRYIDLLSVSPKINIVQVLARFSNSIYHKPIGILKETYTKSGKTAQFFLTEYHDSENNKTRLMTSLYINYYKTTYILRFDDLEIYYGINIEDFYINPKLFNNLLPNNEEFIIIYIMKGAEGKNLLLLNRYDYQHSLQVQTKFDKYTLSNYLRDDICEKPKYMQSMFITSFISYDTKDKGIMETNPDESYYKYQQDVGIVISCQKNNGEVEYQNKKIVMPQCLNILNQINGIKKNDLFTLSPTKDRIILDIYNNPNLKSLRNIEIQFLDSYLYNKVFIVNVYQEGKQILISRETTISNPEKITFIPFLFYRKGKSYQIPYRIKQTGFTGISSTCHLTSDFCYFEFYYEDTNIDLDDCKVKYCKECENKTCVECDENIIGIKLDKKNNECNCDVDNGFNKEPNITINMCTCKKGYSFYKDINKCRPDSELNKGSYCIIGQDERSLIYIYDDVPIGQTKYNQNGLPYCKIQENEECNTQTWFKMGKYMFKSAKVKNCVYILYKNKIVMYSNKSECVYIYYDYKNCMNININNEDEYDEALKNAYEYIPDDDKNSLIIKENNNTLFYILNPYTSKTFSSVQLSPTCIQNIKELNNLPSLLIFVANIKKENSISTQVEYSFFNSVPEFMNEELNISSCYDLYNTTLTKRRLQLNLDSLNLYNNTNYTINVDEIVINVQVNWTQSQSQIIEELYNKKGINIFNSSDDFYNDVCNMFTTPENISNVPANVDMYLQERRDIFYITDAICETGCEQIGYDIETSRAVCKCKIKLSTEGYENVTFSPNELDKNFNKKYVLPNIRVMKCIFKNIWIKSPGQIFPIIIIFAFAFLYTLRYLHLSDINKRKENNNDNNYNDDGRNILKCEEPLEKLINKLSTGEEDDTTNNNNDNKNNDNNLISESNNSVIQKPPDEDEGEKFRYNPTKKINDNEDSKINDNKLIMNENQIKDENSGDKISNMINNNDSIDFDDKNKSKDENIINEPNNKEEEEKEEEEENPEELNNNNIKELNIFMNANNIQESVNNGIGFDNNFTKKESNQIPFIKDEDEEIQKEVQAKKNKKSKKKKKKKDKPNPPDRRNIHNGPYMLNPPPQNSERGNLANGGGSGEREPDSICEVIKQKVDKFFFKYIYYYKAQTQNQKDLTKFKRNKCFTFSSFFSLFLSKYIPHSTLFFIFPWFLFTKKDADGYFVKLVVLVLYIALFMTFNMLTEFDLRHLHLYIHRWNEETDSSVAKFVNIFLPFIILYIPIAWIKKALSMTVFCIQEEIKIDNYNKEYKRRVPGKYQIKIQQEKSNIKKFRNNLETNSRLVLILGGLLLFFNWYLATSFCGVYNNSFDCIVVNVLYSILYTKIFSVILHLVSTIIKYFDLKICNKIKFYIADFINCKFLVDCSFLWLCRCCYCCFCKCYKEEYNKEDEDQIDNNSNQRNVSDNSSNMNNNDNSGNNNNDNTATQNIDDNQINYDVVVNQTGFGPRIKLYK